MTKSIRKATLLAARQAADSGDHALAAQLFASVGITYAPSYLRAN